MLSELVSTISDEKMNAFDKVMREQLESYGYSPDEIVKEGRCRIYSQEIHSELRGDSTVFLVTVDKKRLCKIVMYSDIETEETPDGIKYMYVTNFYTKDLTGRE